MLKKKKELQIQTVVTMCVQVQMHGILWNLVVGEYLALRVRYQVHNKIWFLMLQFRSSEIVIRSYRLHMKGSMF